MAAHLPTYKSARCHDKELTSCNIRQGVVELLTKSITQKTTTIWGIKI